MFIVVVHTPHLSSLLLQKYYYVRTFPGVPRDMSRLLSSTAVGMTEITCTWENNIPSTHRELKLPRVPAYNVLYWNHNSNTVKEDILILVS
jgi:hypothetical protein